MINPTVKQLWPNLPKLPSPNEVLIIGAIKLYERIQAHLRDGEWSINIKDEQLLSLSLLNEVIETFGFVYEVKKCTGDTHKVHFYPTLKSFL